MMNNQQGIRQWNIDITSDEQAFTKHEECIRAFLLDCLKELSDEPISSAICHLSVLFTSDPVIQELNATYRGKDQSTDVLSFSQLEGDSVLSQSLGDIVISLDKAKHQATEFGVTIAQELSRLLVHGLLHLFLYDHENVSEEEAMKMFERQDELLRKHEIAHLAL